MTTTTAIDDPLAAMRANLRRFHALIAERSPGGSVIERDGVTAAISPSCPKRSIVNAVVYDDAEALERLQPTLAGAYARAGVRAWMVWVPDRDAFAAAALARAGHVLDARPRAMTLELANAALPAADAIAWERTQDAGALAALNEEAYGLPRGEFAQVMTAVPGSSLQVYLAHLEDQPASCVATLDEGTDCGVYLVATAVSAQRRGLASALVGQALLEARERGCLTSSLQATADGFPVYQRIGFRDHGSIDMWELRESPD